MILPQSGNLTEWIDNLNNSSLSISGHVNVMRNGVVIDDFPIETCRVTLDRTAAVRRTCTVTVAPEMVGTVDMSWQALFAADGNEIRPWYQVTFPDGTVDEVILGTFTIVESQTTFTGTDVVVKVSGSDRSYLLSEAEQLSPLTLPSSTVAVAIETLVSQFSYGFPVSFIITPTTALLPSTGAIVKPGKTVWSQVQDLAASISYEAFFDPYGNLVAQPIPNPSAGSQLVTVDTTSSGGSGLVSATAVSSRKKIYSVFGVVGNGTESVLDTTTGLYVNKKVAVYGQASDLNPADPTYVYGNFGEIGKLTRTGLVSSQSSADTMAAGLLQLQQGAMTGLNVEILPFPVLDAWDVVGVNIPMLGVNGSYVVDGWDVQIHFTGTQTLTVRELYP